MIHVRVFARVRGDDQSMFSVDLPQNFPEESIISRITSSYLSLTAQHPELESCPVMHTLVNLRALCQRYALSPPPPHPTSI